MNCCWRVMVVQNALTHGQPEDTLVVMLYPRQQCCLVHLCRNVLFQCMLNKNSGKSGHCPTSTADKQCGQEGGGGDLRFFWSYLSMEWKQANSAEQIGFMKLEVQRRQRCVLFHASNVTVLSLACGESSTQQRTFTFSRQSILVMAPLCHFIKTDCIGLT